MPKAILIASGKGGIGKTLTSANFSLALNYLGHKVLLIDGNISKPNLSLHFDIPKSRTIHESILRRYDPIEAICTHPSGLQVLLGNRHTSAIGEKEISGLGSVISHLKHSLKSHDFIIIDTAPNYAREFYSAAKAADETIVISSADKVAIHDAQMTIKACDESGSSAVAIILNNHSIMKKVNMQEVEDELRRPVLGQLPNDRHVGKSILLCHPVVCSYPSSRISKAFMEIGKSFSFLNTK